MDSAIRIQPELESLNVSVHWFTGPVSSNSMPRMNFLLRFLSCDT
jgi:hypothetical protein